jgi:hypothetical protein
MTLNLIHLFENNADGGCQRGGAGSNIDQSPAAPMAQSERGIVRRERQEPQFAEPNLWSDGQHGHQGHGRRQLAGADNI